jgi:PAS domain S-box-containing protein
LGDPEREGLDPAGAALIALAQAPLGIAIFDREMRYIAASRQYLTDQGLAPDTPLLGRVHYDVFPDIPPRWREIHRQVIRDAVELSHDADPYERSDGAVEWIRWRAAPWRDNRGLVSGLILYTEVVTPRVEDRQRLEAAEARYRAVFSQAAMGVALVSPDGTLLEVNDRFHDVCHRPRGSLKGLTFQEITYEEDLESDLKAVRALLKGERDTYVIDKRYKTESGEPVWAELTVSIIRKPDGSPDHFVSLVSDISARKRVEAEQQRHQDQLRLMINELNHRVKNTLATVQSMAAQTLRAERDPAAAYAKFEARLLGLSEVHEVLTRERWHGADLGEVAQRALAPFGPASGAVRISGPDVWLAPSAALTMALVFHELATNAVKYGALSSDGGAVDIAWDHDPAAQDLRLQWRESGGPPVALPTRQGFGSRLIERALAGDLNGLASMDFAPGGLVCRLRARLPVRPDLLDLTSLGPARE